jgi:SAM-dependent methyltransferase
MAPTLRDPPSITPGPAFSGSGPGARTRDGCSVELYRSLPYRGDLDGVRDLLKPGTSVLELGAGAGRLTRKLREWGLNVTAVDNSPDMLAHVPEGAARVESDIEDLALGDAFDTALLASCLINQPSPLTRTSFAATARRHLAQGGQLLVERHDPAWLTTAQVGRVAGANGLEVFVEAVRRVGLVTEMTLRYEISNQAWRHSFHASPLSESEIEGLFAEAGFHGCEWFGPKRTWVRAIAS